MDEPKAITLDELVDLAKPYTFTLLSIPYYEAHIRSIRFGNMDLISMILHDNYGHKCGGYITRDDLKSYGEVRKFIGDIKRKLDEKVQLKGE